MGDNGKENGNYYNGLYGWLSNYGPFLGTLNIRCRIVIGTQTGTVTLTTTHTSLAESNENVPWCEKGMFLEHMTNVAAR